MSPRSLARLNLAVILALLVGLVPAPQRFDSVRADGVPPFRQSRNAVSSAALPPWFPRTFDGIPQAEKTVPGSRQAHLERVRLTPDGQGEMPVSAAAAARDAPFDMAEVVEQVRNAVTTLEGGLPYAKNERYLVRFDEGRVLFAPTVDLTLGESVALTESLVNRPTKTLAFSEPVTLTFELARISIGEQHLVTRTKSVATQVDGNAVRHARGNRVVEEFFVRDAGVEQRWWIEAPPPFEGDLQIAVEVETPIALAVHAGSDGFLFQVADDAQEEVVPVVRYSRAVALDAAGRSHRAALDAEELEPSQEGSHRYLLKMEFPADWLAEVEYPLLIDPLIGGLLQQPAVFDQAGDQQRPEVAYNPDDDEYLVVWEDCRHGTDNPDIYAQRVSGEGLLVGENITVSSAPYRQERPQVAYAPGEGVYLIAWQHYPGTADSDYDTLGQIISRTGELVSGTLPIAVDSDPIEAESPDDIVYNSTSREFLVLYQDIRTGYWNMWGRHVSISGTLGAKIQITSLDGQHESQAAGAYNPDDDQYLIVYCYRPNPSGPGDIRGRRMTGSGTVTAMDTITIATGASQQRQPDVAYLPEAGRYAVVWEDDRNSSTSGFDVYAQLVSPTGTLDGGHTVIAEANQNEQRPRLDFDGTGGAMVVWERDNGASAGYDLYGRRLGSNGVPLADPFAILEIEEDQRLPVLAGNVEGGYLMAWQDNRNGNWDVYGRQIAADNALSHDVIFHPVPGDQDLPEAAYNPDDDEYLVVWRDYRNGVNNAHIYAQRISGDGILLGENITVTGVPNNQTTPKIAYAAGEGVYLVAWRHYPDVSKYYLDAYAQLISRTGELVGSPLAIANGSGSGELEAVDDVVYNSTAKKFLVLWHDLRSGFWNVWGRQVSITGTMGAPTQITFLSSQHEDNAAGAYNPDDDQYLIVYRYRSSASAPGDIRSRRMTGSGTVTAAETINIATGTAEQQLPDSVYLPAIGRYLVVWEDDRNSATSGFDVYEQLISPDGSLDGSNRVVAADTQDERYPRLGTDGSGQALTVWARDNGGNEGFDLYGRRQGVDGMPVASPFSILKAASDQTSPVAAGGETGSYLLAWQDNGSGNWDVYAGIFEPLRAGFTATPTHGSAPLTVQFSDASTPQGAADQWFWTFGDGGSSTAQHPVYTYTHPATTRRSAELCDAEGSTGTRIGVYTVTQRVTDTDSGEWDLLIHNRYITVTDVPVTGLEATNDSPTELGQATNLTATVTAGTNVTYAWAFGDGETGRGAVVSHTYRSAGTYTAVATASNSANLITATTAVTVTEGSITGLVATNDSPTELGQATHLTATVTAGANVAYAWAFGDGETGRGAVVSHTYPSTGTYTAVVIADNSVSLASATTVVRVTDVPIDRSGVVFLPILILETTQ